MGTTQICTQANSRRDQALPSDRGGRDSGFSLIEVLVALAILALAISVALPSLNSGLAAASRQAILTDVSRQLLEYRLAAFDSGTASVLSPVEPFSGPQKKGSASRVTLTLPSRWSYRVGRPIVFSADGYCSGGQVLLELDGRQQMVMDLAAGRCVTQSD